MREQQEEKKVYTGPWYYLKEPSGEKSVTVTMLWVSFLVTIVVYALSAFPTVFGHEVRPFDALAPAAVFGLLLSSYSIRKVAGTNAAGKIAVASLVNTVSPSMPPPSVSPQPLPPQREKKPSLTHL